MVGFIGPAEIVLIAAAAGIFLFGGKKVKEWARDIGEAKREFGKVSTKK